MPERLPFPEAVALEKQYWKQFDDDATASSKLRRRLFQGHTLCAQDGVDAGGSNGILGATTRVMEEWGFIFERSENAEGKKQVKLTNPQHVPTVHIKKPTTGVRRNRRQKEDDDQNGDTPKNGSPIHEKIREVLLAGEEISIGETMGMGASNAFLRKEVSRMTDEGYKISSVGHGVDRTYRVTKHPKGKQPPSNENGNGKAKGKELAKIPGKDVARNGVNEMMFGELSTPLPNLGRHVRVIGMMLDEEDDTVSLAVKDETGTWMARIEGFVDPNADE